MLPLFASCFYSPRRGESAIQQPLTLQMEDGKGSAPTYPLLSLDLRKRRWRSFAFPVTYPANPEKRWVPTFHKPLCPTVITPRIPNILTKSCNPKMRYTPHGIRRDSNRSLHTINPHLKPHFLTSFHKLFWQVLHLYCPNTLT